MWDLQIFGIDFYRVFWCFFSYCFVGWIWESCYCSTIEGKLINRGFLNGPVIPIYGCAATSIFMVFFNPSMIHLTVNNSIEAHLTIFVLGAVVASLFEYITSWSMELMFHAKWWDYSKVPLNIKGRICLPISCFWGLASVLLVKVLHPFVLGVIDDLPRNVFEVLGYIVFGLFMTDTVATTIATVELDKKLTAIARIREEVGDLLADMREFEVRTKIDFKDKYGETAIGDVLEHGFDRIDASIAFFHQGHEERMAEFDDKVDSRVQAVDKVLAVFKINREKFMDNSKTKIENFTDELKAGFSKVKGSFKGFSKYTAKRLSLAFPNMRFNGIRESAMAEIIEKTGLFEKRNNKKNSKPDDSIKAD